MNRTAAESRDLSVRLKYLDEAARYMALASPETSSFLGAQFNYVLAENDLVSPESRKREEPGQRGKPTKKRSKVQKSASSETGKCCRMKIYSCLRCSTKTRLPIPSTKARIGARKPVAASVTEISTPAAAAATATAALVQPAGATSAAAPATAPANPAPANVNSKKRAKARKGGLQALLANSKKETNPSKGFGLDLMDLMRGD